MSSFDELNDEEKELIRMARRKGIRPKDLENALLTSPKLKQVSSNKDEDNSDEPDIMKMIDKIQKKALEMKLNMAILDQIGLGDGGKDSIKELVKELTSKQEETMKDLKDTIKEVLEKNHEKGDKISPSEMMNMVIMLKALGGEKSSDEEKALMKELLKKAESPENKGLDPLALLDKVQEIQAKAKEQDMELLTKNQPVNVQEEEETLDKFISKETMNALKENIANNIKEVFNPQKKLVNEKGQIDVGALAEKIIGIVGDTIKRIPITAPPPKSTEEFEKPPIDTTGNVVGNEAQNQQAGSVEAPPPPPPPPPQEQPIQQQPPQQQERPKLPIEGQGE